MDRASMPMAAGAAWVCWVQSQKQNPAQPPNRASKEGLLQLSGTLLALPEGTRGAVSPGFLHYPRLWPALTLPVSCPADHQPDGAEPAPLMPEPPRRSRSEAGAAFASFSPRQQ